MTETMMHSDITDFFTNGKETLICSDYEGTIPTAQMAKFQEVFSNPNKQVVYLGDIFDNTGDCKAKTENYCALNMLKLLIDNPEKSRYVVGNRDINKIKLVPLLQFREKNKWWVLENDKLISAQYYKKSSTYGITNTHWSSNTKKNLTSKAKPQSNNKLNNLSKIAREKFSKSSPLEVLYTGIVTKLINDNITSDGSNWKVQTMEDYVPFWANKKQDKLQKLWYDKGSNIQPMKTLYDRFVRIFGGDTTEGTMSANNTLTGIPNELFKKYKIDDFITNIKTKIDKEKLIENIVKSTVFIENIKSENKKRDESDPKKTPLTDEDKKKLSEKFLDFEIRSAIVFTAFMRMLDETLYTSKSLEYDGYLWKYLSQSSPALYAKTEKELLLFSHGGVTTEFVNTNCFDILNKITETQWKKVLEKPTNLQFDNPKNTQDKILVDFDIIEKIKKYNNEYMIILKKCFENFNNFQFNTDLMILLSISAPAENNFNMFTLGYTSSNFSPIQPKLPANSILTKEGENLHIFNICGHASSGYGYGFKKLSDKMHFINTDFTGNLFTCANFDQNYLILTITYNEKDKDLLLKLDGNILFQFTGKRPPQFFVDNEEKKVNEIQITIGSDAKISDFFSKDKVTTQFTNTPSYDLYFYNGIARYNKKDYKQFSYYSFDETKFRLMLDSLYPDKNFGYMGETVNNHRGGYRKKRSIHKSKKNRMTKQKLYKKNKQNHSRRAKKSKSKY